MNYPNDPGHGHSPAAWTAVIVMIIGLSLGTVFFFLAQWEWVIASAVLVAAGWLSGFVLSALGWGVNGPKYQPKGH